MKRCSKCKVVKNFELFGKDKYNKDKLTNACLMCRRINTKRHYFDNREECLKKNKKWRLENNKRVAKRKSIFYQQNKEKIRKYEAKRRAIPEVRIARNLRIRICNSIRRGTKSGSAVKDLGCSIEQLKKHLEKQFQADMSWDNYGPTGWHIDHIKPLISFELTDRKQFLEACHYTNLQPLWSWENSKKGGKYG